MAAAARSPNETYTGNLQCMLLVDDAAVDFVLSYGTCTAPVAGPTMVTAKLESTGKWVACCSLRSGRHDWEGGQLTGGQPEEEAVGGGVDARAVGQDGGQVQGVLQGLRQVLELGQQPGARVGDDDAHHREAPKVPICAPTPVHASASRFRRGRLAPPRTALRCAHIPRTEAPWGRQRLFQSNHEDRCASCWG